MPNTKHLAFIVTLAALLTNPAPSAEASTAMYLKHTGLYDYTMEKFTLDGYFGSGTYATDETHVGCDFDVAYKIERIGETGNWTCNNINTKIDVPSCYSYLLTMSLKKTVVRIYQPFEPGEYRLMNLEISKNKRVAYCAFYYTDPDAQPPKPPVSCRITPGEAIVIGPLKNTDTVSGRTSITLNCTEKASVRITAGGTGGAAHLTYAKGGKLNLQVEGGTTSKPNSAIHAVVRGDNIPLDVTATTVPGTANPGSYSASIIVTAEVL
jgi:hypothetical protein